MQRLDLHIALVAKFKLFWLQNLKGRIHAVLFSFMGTLVKLFKQIEDLLWKGIPPVCPKFQGLPG